MQQASFQRWVRLGFALVGLFGAAIAVTAVLVGLPAPAAGGTCGPGQSSEPAIVALFDPASIGAGAEPPATDATAHTQWLAFIGECQASTNGRSLLGLALLVLSIGIAFGGPKLVLRKNRAAVPSPPPPGWYPDPMAPQTSTRWWDGTVWGPPSPAPATPVPPSDRPVTAPWEP